MNAESNKSNKKFYLGVIFGAVVMFILDYFDII